MFFCFLTNRSSDDAIVMLIIGGQCSCVGKSSGLSNIQWIVMYSLYVNTCVELAL